MGSVAALATVLLYLLFHGYFDPGQFEIKQFQWSSADQVAMLAERSNNNEALGGLEYFVLIGNHLFAPGELRHAYYSDAVVFNAASNCLKLHWRSPNNLVVKCEGSTVERNDINVQKQKSGKISISYENIALN